MADLTIEEICVWKIAKKVSLESWLNSATTFSVVAKVFLPHYWEFE